VVGQEAAVPLAAIVTSAQESPTHVLTATSCPSYL